ncbi:hypothetical protein [Mycobacterium sp. Marseille-P9652]
MARRPRVPGGQAQQLIG